VNKTPARVKAAGVIAPWGKTQQERIEMRNPTIEEIAAHHALQPVVDRTNAVLRRLHGATGEIRQTIHSEDALIDAYNDGWEHGACDARDHRDYDRSLAETRYDAWDERYAAGYDAGFAKIAELRE